MRQIVLDTETTGLETSAGHRIIEIGAIELVNRRFTENNFHFHINPERDIDVEAEKVHGISKAFLADKPVFSVIAENFFDYIKDAELIIHNAPFDVEFINSEFSRFYDKKFSIETHCNIVDTLVLARLRHPGQRNGLDALCKRYGVDNSNRKFHGALLDAQLLADVYLAMTGGQGSLFGEEMENTPKIHKEASATHDTVFVNQQFKIIYANEKELAAHNKKLQAIKK